MTPNNSHHLSNVIVSFLEYIEKQRGYSGHTVNAYREDLSLFAKFAQETFGETALDKTLTKGGLRSFIFSLRDRGLKPRSVARKVAALKSFAKYCTKKAFVSHNPARNLPSPRLDKPLPVFLTMRQTAKLTEVAHKEEKTSEVRNRAIVELLYGSGIRLNELHTLNADTIDRRNLLVRVLGKGRKERIVPVTPHAIELIDRYVAMRCDAKGSSAPLFTNGKGLRLSRRQIERIVARTLSPVSLNKKRSPHVLRHSFATHLMDGGADIRAVKELLGHASLATTQVYTHVSKEHLRRVYRQAHPRSSDGASPD